MRKLPQKKGAATCSESSLVSNTAALAVPASGQASHSDLSAETAAPAQCGAKCTERTENLCTDLSDLGIKRTEISAFCASRDTPEEYSSLLEIKEKASDLHFSLPFFFLTTEHVLGNICCIIPESFFFFFSLFSRVR